MGFWEGFNQTMAALAEMRRQQQAIVDAKTREALDIADQELRARQAQEMSDYRKQTLKNAEDALKYNQDRDAKADAREAEKTKRAGIGAILEAFSDPKLTLNQKAARAKTIGASYGLDDAQIASIVQQESENELNRQVAAGAVPYEMSHGRLPAPEIDVPTPTGLGVLGGLDTAIGKIVVPAMQMATWLKQVAEPHMRDIEPIDTLRQRDTSAMQTELLARQIAQWRAKEAADALQYARDALKYKAEQLDYENYGKEQAAKLKKLIAEGTIAELEAMSAELDLIAKRVKIEFDKQANPARLEGLLLSNRIKKWQLAHPNAGSGGSSGGSSGGTGMTGNRQWDVLTKPVIERITEGVQAWRALMDHNGPRAELEELGRQLGGAVVYKRGPHHYPFGILVRPHKPPIYGKVGSELVEITDPKQLAAADHNLRDKFNKLQDVMKALYKRAYSAFEDAAALPGYGVVTQMGGDPVPRDFREFIKAVGDRVPGTSASKPQGKPAQSPTTPRRSSQAQTTRGRSGNRASGWSVSQTSPDRWAIH